MEIKIVNEDGSPKEEAKTEIGQPSNSFSSGEIEQMAVADVIGLERNEYSKYSKNLNTLIEYAKTQTDDPTPENLKWVIRQLSFKVGTPPLGEKLAPYLSRYAYLALERNKIAKEIEKFES